MKRTDYQNTNGVFVTGTDTGVGKTFVSALLVKALRDKGVDVGYIKPVASGAHQSGSSLSCEDVEFVQHYGQAPGRAHELCPILLGPPLSPYAAARKEGITLDLDEVLAACSATRTNHSFTVVEGVGGLLVPLTRGYTVLDLVKMLQLPVLVVCRAGLGTINHTLLTLDALKRAEVGVAGFVTNGEIDADDPSVEDNPRIIEEFSGCRFLAHIPPCPDLDREFANWTRYILPAVSCFPC